MANTSLGAVRKVLKPAELAKHCIRHTRRVLKTTNLIKFLILAATDNLAVSILRSKR